MPYYLLDDKFADLPVWDVLSDGSDALADRLQSAFARLAAATSGLLVNGYCTEQFALKACRGRRDVLALLTKAVLEEQPFLHRPGDDCKCLGGAWVEGYGYRIHAFLRRNPSRKEYERDREQKADLRDARLKTLVYERDGGCCRYCRSGPLSPKAGRSKDRRKVLSHDHVDPDRPAGVDGANLVIACGRCNDDKGHRTPDEADMPLLPALSEAQLLALRGSEQVLRDRTDDPSNSDSNSDVTATDHQTDAVPITDRNSDPVGDPESDPNTITAPADRVENGEQSTEQDGSWSGKGVGSGRVGKPVAGHPRPPPDTPRSPDAPDIYHRRSRSPTTEE